MPTRLRILLAATVVALPTARAQGTLERGSAARQAALDALRTEIRDDAGLRGAVSFTDVQIRTAGDWAHVTATPQRPGGAPTRHCERDGPDEPGDAQIDALLRRRGARWRVVDWGSCATDVWYVGWGFRFGLPAALSPEGAVRFPYTATVLAADGFLSLRSAPSVTRGERLARIPTDTQVEIQSCQAEVETVDGVSGRWCRARYAGRDGWVFSGFLY